MLHVAFATISTDARSRPRRAQRLGTRWTQPLFPLSGRSPFGTGNAGIVVDLLGTRRREPPTRLDPMFALGQKQTVRHFQAMSAPPIADIGGRS